MKKILILIVALLLLAGCAKTPENAVKDGHFASVEDSPNCASSMGAELVYQARTVLLLASGARKSEPVAASLADAPSPAVPISYGQKFAANGGNMIYVVDAAAAKDLLARKAEIEARGTEIVDLTSAPACPPVSSLAFARDPASGFLA